MNQTMEDLRMLVDERISVTKDYQEKIRALAIAKMAVMNELEQQTGESAVPLLDVYASIDGERQELHEQMVFEAALKLGMELGRLEINA